MKLVLRTIRLRATPSLREQLERQFRTLEQAMQIVVATVTLEKFRDSQPRFRAEVHLAVPGPDIRAVGYDCSVPAALRKASRCLAKQFLLREVRHDDGCLTATIPTC